MSRQGIFEGLRKDTCRILSPNRRFLKDLGRIGCYIRRFSEDYPRVGKERMLSQQDTIRVT